MGMEYAIIVVETPLAVPGMRTRTATGSATIVEWPKAAANRPAVQAMLTWTGTAYVTTG